MEDRELQEILNHPIAGNFHQDSDLFDTITLYVADPKHTLENRLKALQKMDIAMTDDTAPLPGEQDLIDYLTDGDIKYIPSVVKAPVIQKRPRIQESMQHKKLYNKVLLNISESDYNQAKVNLEKIFEAKLRARISTSLQQVDEGLFDRLGARAAGLGAGLKTKAQNLGTRVGSAVKAVGQNVAGAVTGKGFSAGQSTVDQANKDIAANDPRKAAKAAQANNIIASFAKDLSTLYPSINPQKLLSNLRTQLNLAKP